MATQIHKNPKARYPLFVPKCWQSPSENHHVHKSASSTHGLHLLALVGHFVGFLRGEEGSSLWEKLWIISHTDGGALIGPRGRKGVNKLQLDEWDHPDVQNLSCLLYVIVWVSVCVCVGVCFCTQWLACVCLFTHVLIELCCVCLCLIVLVYRAVGVCLYNHVSAFQWPCVCICVCMELQGHACSECLFVCVDLFNVYANGVSL